MKEAYSTASALVGGFAIGAIITAYPQYAIAWALVGVLLQMHSDAETK